MSLIGRRRGTCAFVAIVLALTTAACSSDDKRAPKKGEAPATTSAAPEPVARSPLTGLPFDGQPPKHPVYVVKIDNTAAARPQIGLNRADLVIEELVEGGLTRLAALFYARTPTVVGPVRSMRATDIGIVKPARGTLIASGGASPTIRRIKSAKVTVLSEDTGRLDLFTKDPNRRLPYNRLLDLKALAAKAKPAKAPSPYLPFSATDDFTSTNPATAVTVAFGATSRTQWAFDKGRWTRQNGLTAPGKEFKADNLLVLTAKIGDAGYVDAAGSPVPETIFEGKGKAQLFHDGRVVRGRWYKKRLSSALTLKTLDGEALAVPPGRTWIELIPATTGSISITKR